LPPHPREWIYQAKMMKTDKAFMKHFEDDPDNPYIPRQSDEEKKIEEAIRQTIRKVLA
jgi:hypothetical protein